MLKCKFLSNGTKDNLDELKIASLYYDQVDLLSNIVYTTKNLEGAEENVQVIRGIHECIEPQLSTDISLLEREGVIKVEKSKDVSITPVDPKELEEYGEVSQFEIDLLMKSQEIMARVGNRLWSTKESDGKVLFLFNEEVAKVHSTFIEEFKIGSKVDFGFVHKYYSNLLYYAVKYLDAGENLVNSSNIIDTYFLNFYSQSIQTNQELFNKLGKPDIGLEAIKYFVPDVSVLTIEDILELRLKLKDELISYRQYTSELNESIIKNKDGETQNKIEYYLDNKINPSLKDLERKILKSKLNVGEKFLAEMKDPKSYTPIVGNIFLNMPAHVTLLLSMGLIGANTFLKWKQEALDFKNNGLYYLLKLKKRAR